MGALWQPLHPSPFGKLSQILLYLCTQFLLYLCTQFLLYLCTQFSVIFVHTIDNFLYCLHIQFLTLIIQICCMFASSCGQHCRLSIRSNFGSVYQILSNTSKSKYQLMVRRSGLSMQMQNIFEPTFLDFHFARFLATFIQIQIHESGPFVV